MDFEMIDQRVRELLRGTEFRSTMLDAQRTLFKPRTITTQAELTQLTQTATDGDECYFDNGNGVRWRFRYNAASPSPYRWGAVGGQPPLLAEIPTGEARLAATFGDMATVGPSITVPLSGDYDVTVEAEAEENTAGGQVAMSYDIGTTAAVTADEARSTTAAFFFVKLRRERRKTGLTAGSAIVAKYLATSLNGTFRSRLLKIQPVRVG